MTLNDRAELRALADERVRQAQYSPRRLVLLSSGVALGTGLAIALLNYLLSWQMDAHTGGLAGIPLRTVLETLRTALQSAYSIASPFWGMGLVCAMLCVARGRQAPPASLLEGFRRFGPVLRMQLLLGLIALGVGLVCMNVSSMVFVLTPFARPMMALMEENMQLQTPEQLEQLMEQAVQYMLPVLAIFAVLYLAVMLPLMYRFRMASYAVMDVPGTRAREALRTSLRIMKGNRWKLFRLELSFWPYYVLYVPVLLLAYADQLLPALGVKLPVSETAAFLGAYVLYVLAALALQTWMQPKMQTAYALAYEVLLQQKPVPQKLPANVPWDYE